MSKEEKTIDLNKSINSESEEFKNLSKDLQGNILSPHARDYAAHIFIEFKVDIQSAQKFIKKYLVDRITTSAKQKADSDAFKTGKSKGFRTFINFSLSMNGYKFFNVEEHKTPRDSSFRNGMKSKQRSLNDPMVNLWEDEYQKDWHAVMIVSNKSHKNLRNRVSAIKKELTKTATSVYVEMGKGIRNNEGNHIEHFGYVDGISQPHMLTDKIEDGKISIENWNPEGKLNLALVKDPGGVGTNSFGSYLVFRKLDQNVKAFRLAEKKLAEKMQISVDYAGAQMVGRYRNGTPLIPISPPQPTSAGKMNDFDFSSDRTTVSKCPFGSHIRKTNQRGSGKPDGIQFPRRGITYGGNLTTDAESGVGLLFMAYNSNIGAQFEFMQSAWANSAHFPGGTNGPNGIDSIIGQGNDAVGQAYFKKWDDDTSVFRENPSLGGFVTMKGGEYFFTPSISFLKNI